MTAVLDSSAILALIWQEKGHEIVSSHLTDACMSTVNLAEVYSKCQERGLDLDAMRGFLASLKVTMVGYDEQQAFATGALRSQTVRGGLSLGDRACLSLAMAQGASVVTADGIWQSLGLPLQIVAIR